MEIAKAILSFLPKLSPDFSSKMTQEASDAGKKAGNALADGMVNAVASTTTKMANAGRNAGRAAGKGVKEGVEEATEKIDPKISHAKFFTAGRTASAAFKKGYDAGGGNLGTFGSVAAIAASKITLVGIAAGAAAPGLIKFAGAVAPAAGALLAIPAGVAGVVAAGATLKIAVLGVGDAISTGLTGSSEEAKAALEALPPEAEKFARTIVGLDGTLEKLQARISNNFFAPINESFKPLVTTYLPVADKYLPRIASSLGVFGENFARAARSGPLFDGINAVLDRTAKGLARANDNVGPLTDSLGHLLIAGAPWIQKLGEWFAEATGRISKFIAEAAKTGQLSEWISDGVATVKDLFAILGNIGGILRAVYQGATQDGNNLLASIRDLTQQVEDFLKSAQGMEGMAAAFKIFSDIGAAIRQGLGAVLPAVAKAFVILGPTVAEVLDVFADLIVALAPLIPHLAGVTVLIVRELIPALRFLVKLISENGTAVKIAATAIIAAVVAYKTYIVVATLAGKAALAFNGAQKILNGTMKLNPFAIVVTAIVALVAAIVLAWKNSETFREIVMKAWDGIKTAAVVAWSILKPILEGIVDLAKDVGAAATWLWNNAIKPAWDAITKETSLLWNSYIKPIVGYVIATFKDFGEAAMWLWNHAIKPAWQEISAIIKDAWNNIIKPILETAIGFLKGVFTATWEALWKLIQVVWNNISGVISGAWNVIVGIFNAIIGFIKGVFTGTWTDFGNAIKQIWDGIKSLINVAWEYIKGIFNAVITFLGGTFKAAWEALKQLISVVWEAIKTAISQAWNFIKTNILDPAMNFLKSVFGPVWTGLKTVIETVWGGIKTAISTAWNFIRDNIFTPIGKAIGVVATAFETAGTAIKKVWDTIVEIVKKPIRFVIETVINGGIIKGANWLLDAVGLDSLKIPNVPMPFADGGIYPGYTPGKDIGYIGVSGGEAIMRPEFTRVAGPQFVHGANKAARTGGMAGVSQWLKQWVNNMGGDEASPVVGYQRGVHPVFGRGRVPYLGGFDQGGVVSEDDYKKWEGDGASAVANVPSEGGVFSKAGSGMGTKLLKEVGKWLYDKISGFFQLFDVYGNYSAGKVPQAIAAQMDFIKAQAGKPYVWAAVGPDGYDCSGLVGTVLGNRLGSPYKRMFNTDSADGFFPNPTDFKGTRVGDVHMPPILAGWARDGERGGGSVGHMAGEFAGVKFESRGGTGVIIGPGAASISSFARKGASKFDQGGWLRPNTFGVNLTGKPEAVLDPDESRGLKAMGVGELAELLRELIDAVHAVAPGVADGLRGSAHSLRTKGRLR